MAFDPIPEMRRSHNDIDKGLIIPVNVATKSKLPVCTRQVCTRERLLILIHGVPSSHLSVSCYLSQTLSELSGIYPNYIL